MKITKISDVFGTRNRMATIMIARSMRYRRGEEYDFMQKKMALPGVYLLEAVFFMVLFNNLWFCDSAFI